MKESSDVICNIEELKNKELFKNVKYYIIGKTHEQVRKLLADGGAKESTYLTELVTLVIADDPNHIEVDEAADVFDIAVVTSRWVLLSAKCGSLLPKNGFKPGITQIFSGVCACPSHVHRKDNEALWAMITFHGGKYNAALNQKCTHLIATSPNGTKYNHAMKVGSSLLKIVTPDWIYDCVKSKKRLEENKYHPRLLSVPVNPNPPPYEPRSVPQCSTSSAEDSPLEGLLLPENVALQLDSLLDDVASSDSIDLPSVSPISTSQRKDSVLMSPTITASSNVENVVKISSAALTVKTSTETESAPLQIKSSQWMTQQVQGVFSQQQQSLSPASNTSPTFNVQPTLLGRELSGNWQTTIEGQIKDVQISGGKVQQVVRVAVPSQYLVQQRQQQPSSQHPQQLQLQSPQANWQQQQQIQQPIRSPGAQSQPQQLLTRPQQIQWHPGQLINQQQPPRQLQMTPQQRAQVLAMQQQQQQTTQQTQLQQTAQRPMPPAWQRQGIPRDAAPQFIGQPQTQMTMVRTVMVQRTGVPGPSGQPQVPVQGASFWYQRGHHPQQIQGRVAWQQHPPQRDMINVQLQQQQLSQQQQNQPQSLQQQQQIQSQQIQQQQMQSQQVQQQQMQSQQMQHQRPPNDQSVGLQIQRDGAQGSPHRYPIPVQQQSLKEGLTTTLHQDRQQLPVGQQQQFIREPAPSQMIIQREISQQEVLHSLQIKDGSGIIRQHPQASNNSQSNLIPNTAQKLVQQSISTTQQQPQIVHQHMQQQQGLQQSPIQQQQQQQQQQRESHPASQPMSQIKTRDGQPSGVAVSTPSTHSSNWPPPSPQVKQMLCQQQQLQQQAQRQIHPQSIVQHIQILQQQQQAQLRASVGQIRPSLIQQQMQQRPLGQMQSQPMQQQLQRPITAQRIPLTGLSNLNKFPIETTSNNQVQINSIPTSGGVVSAGIGHEQSTNVATTISIPVQQQTQTPSPRDSLHQVVQQGQEQIQQQLQNLANFNQSQQLQPKTKTALANLLNTRLQGGSKVPDTELVAQPAVVRFPGPGIQPQQVCQSPREPIPTDHQRTLRNITNSGNTTIMVRAAGPKQGATRFAPPSQITLTQPAVPRVQFFAHDPAFKVPPDLCLLGCMFCIIDYERIIDSETLKVWSKVIEQHGGEIDSDYSNRCTHVLCATQRNSIVQQAMREGKRCVTAAWLNDVIAVKRMIPPWLALHFPTAFSEDKPCKHQIISISNFEGEERQRLKLMILQTGAKYTGYFSRSNTLLICRKAEGIKYKSAKEWKVPCVNVEWLQDVLYGHYDALRLMFAQKYVQFNSEDPFKVDYALVPHLMAAWRVPVRVTEETWKKFVPNSATLAALIQERNKRKQEEAERRAKKLRLSPPLVENIPITSRFPPAKDNRPVVLFTGLRGTTELSQKVLELGGLLAKNYKECTHLITDSVCRTVKFMCALNVCKYVLTKNWILESAKENRFIDEKPHILQDSSNEDHFGCFIKEITARSDRSPLFKGLTFYLTPGVKPSLLVLKEIIESAGGTVVSKCPAYKDIILANKTSPTFIIITCENDSHLCKEIIKKNISVYNVEFVMTGVMRQELDFKAFPFTVNEPNGVKTGAN